MRVAALILSILGGLSGLSFAAYANVALLIFGAVGLPAHEVGLAKLLIFGLPIASFIGGGLALSRPGTSGVILIASALGYLIIAGWLQTNFFTISTMVLIGVGGLLALASSQQDETSTPTLNVEPSGQPEQFHIQQEPTPSFTTKIGGAPPLGVSRVANYDQAKWQALLEFDSDLARIEATLRPYGQKYVDQFATGYLILNDKAYIPNIIQKVIETARQDAAKAKAIEERMGARYSDPTFLLKFSYEKFDYLMNAPFGNVGILKNGAVLVERNGRISKYPDAGTLRESANDQTAWPEIIAAESRIRLVKVLAQHIPP